MDREQARAEYRKILAGVVRHHQAMDRHVTGAALARIAKRLGLRVKGGVIEAGDDEMTLVSDLAVYGRVAGSTRAIDRYARAVAGSLDTFDKDLLEALRRSWFSVFRFTSRHPIAGWYVDDRLLDRTGLWLMNEALERSARAGMGLGARVFEFGSFVVTTGGAAPLTGTLMDGLVDDLRERQGRGAMKDADVMAFYRLTMSLGLVARHRNILDDDTPVSTAGRHEEHQKPPVVPLRRAWKSRRPGGHAPLRPEPGPGRPTGQGRAPMAPDRLHASGRGPVDHGSARHRGRGSGLSGTGSSTSAAASGSPDHSRNTTASRGGSAT